MFDAGKRQFISTAKSADFHTKKPFLPYVPTKQIADASEWTIAEIVERQKTLASIAVKTWSI
jgi:hypothetical protein